MPFGFTSQSKNLNKQAGFSLLELLIVIIILGFIAAVITPGLSTNNSNKIDSAAEEVAQALRFARSEAVRTGKAHGVHAETSAQRLRVYEVKEVFGLPVPDYSVRHPIDKKLFQLLFDQGPNLEGMQLSSTTFTFVGLGIPVELLSFDGTGLPKHIVFGAVYMLETATVVVSDGSKQKTVSVAPMTGRVTVY